MCRLLVGLGVTGLYSVDITLVQEFVPASKRGWLTGLTTTMLPAGVLLGALLGGLCNAVYRLARPLRHWTAARRADTLYPCLGPESPHWLMRMGRVEEARRSIAWALQVDPASIQLPGRSAAGRADPMARAVQLSAQPRRRMPDWPTETGGVALALWMVTLFVMVLK